MCVESIVCGVFLQFFVCCDKLWVVALRGWFLWGKLLNIMLGNSLGSGMSVVVVLYSDIIISSSHYKMCFLKLNNIERSHTTKGEL